MSGRSRSELDQLGSQHGFAAAPVMDFGEIYRDEHYRRRRAVWLFEDPVYGETALPGPVPKMSETPPRVKWTGRPVGFHNEYVFTKLLGLTKPELEELERKGVIGKWLDMVGRKPPDDWTGEGRFF